MNYKGIIIEESLEKKDILQDTKIINTEIEEVAEEHRTPWIKQWTLHSVEIPENQVNKITERISKALDSKHSWYADFKNKTHHYIVFKDKVFCVNRENKEQYKEVKHYGISLDIPEYQLDFNLEDEE